MTHYTHIRRAPSYHKKTRVDALDIRGITVGGGPELASILAGSANVALSAVAACTQVKAAKTLVSGMDENYLVFLSGCTTACGVVITGAVGSDGGFRAEYLNTGSAQMGASTLAVDFFAVKLS